jgi:hypothetical protein
MTGQAVGAVGDDDLRPVPVNQSGEAVDSRLERNVGEGVGRPVGRPARHARVAIPKQFDMPHPKLGA